MAGASIGQAAIGALLGIRQPCCIRGLVNTVQQGYTRSPDHGGLSSEPPFVVIM
jgi:hypothetical protein